MITTSNHIAESRLDARTLLAVWVIFLTWIVFPGCKEDAPVSPIPDPDLRFTLSGRLFAIQRAETVWVSQATMTIDTHRVVAVTNDGSFRLDSLAEGTYTLSIEAAGYTPHHETLRLRSDTVRYLRLFGLFRLTGTAFGMLAGDTLRAESASVSINGRWSTTTDTWGRFSFERVLEGDHNITVQHPHFRSSQVPIKLDSTAHIWIELPLSSEAMDHFPLDVGLRFVYGYTYDFQDRGTAIRPGTGSIDSGTVTYEILRREDASGEIRQWTVRESRHLYHRELKNDLGGDPLYDAVTPYWIDTTVTLLLTEALDGGHALTASALVWNLPFFDESLAGWAGEEVRIQRYGIGSSIVRIKTIVYMTDIIELQAGRGIVRRSVEEHGSCNTCGDLSVSAILIEGP